ncbi:D-glycerate dehydrogenase [Mesobaculum littorinae]|uniref:D-glycerate dehydrogenase n=1 Tax=Mesobaculum littorinae TaxID=2486419 RepID=A0A438AIG6_9RHOB|nr:D-glycerate dehydrogenase [Mesobaculum littorinae]RVV98444.1 D-glycerate dehydrogenase [Mesobaculum littorinae]
MPKVLITRTLPDSVMAAARDAFDVATRDSEMPMTAEEAAATLSLYDAVLPTLGDAYSAQAFGLVPEPKVKLLANFGVGYNHIDVGAAKAAGVAVANTPGAVTDATADIAMMLILMSCRRAGEGERLVRAGDWTGWHPTQLLGLHLGGKTLGIVGMGRIGKAIARRAQAGFGMEVIFHNRSRVADAGVPARQVDTLDELARAADVVVLAVPATPETRHLVDAGFLSAMRPHARLVNIARGDIVDEAALIAALEAGEIGGAGLDVYEGEPQVPQALRDRDDVALLPHLGTAALEVREAMGMMAVENLRAFFAGETPPNLVEP